MQEAIFRLLHVVCAATLSSYAYRTMDDVYWIKWTILFIDITSSPNRFKKVLHPWFYLRNSGRSHHNIRYLLLVVIVVDVIVVVSIFADASC